MLVIVKKKKIAWDGWPVERTQRKAKEIRVAGLIFCFIYIFYLIIIDNYYINLQILKFFIHI